jgi:hypothetical protein
VVAAAQLGLRESFGLVAGHGHHAAMPGDMGPGWTGRMVDAHLFVTVLTAVLWWAGRRAASYVVSLLLRPASSVATPPRPRQVGVRLGSSLLHLLVPPGRGPPPAVLPT